ncbi:TPA: hypothetical protein ROS49_005393 [Escherichia coli]|nr:hypothetical protein [Escherichia coli]
MALSLAVYSAFRNINTAGAAGLWLNVSFGLLALLSILFIIPGKQDKTAV